MAPTRTRSRLETIDHDLAHYIRVLRSDGLDLSLGNCRSVSSVAHSRSLYASSIESFRLDLLSLPEKGVRLFFERSGQCPMHLCSPSTRFPTLLTHVAHRIVCLNLRNMVDYPMEIVFPVLERLRIHVCKPIPAAHLTTHRFPALRQLMPWITGPLDEENFPALSSLVVSPSPSDRAWIDVIIATRHSLISLTIIKRIRIVRSVTDCEITVPQLRSLEVWDWTKGLPCPITLHTPCLTTYADHVSWMITASPTHDDVSTVTHTRLSKPPVLTKFTSLIHLQYEGSEVCCLAVLLQLEANEDACPHLALIEYYVSLLFPQDISMIDNKTRSLNTNRKSPFRVAFSELVGPFTGISTLYLVTDEYKCGHAWHWGSR